ncbi:MAG: guanine deaminase [Trueperaceae bacterium]|nr:guanine deaminase [Trueperaceae bacterium]
MPPTLLRAHLLHTPDSPFAGGALQAFDRGGLVFDDRDGTILALGDADTLAADYPGADTLDYRDAFVLPGFVDTHVHYPQVPIVGAMGLELLDWLRERTLPEEARYADVAYARDAARTFLRLLAGNGTTTALVFGAHFADAQQVFFEEAEASGLRITSGLNLADRNLRPELEDTPDHHYQLSETLIRRWHGRGRLRYALTPRFSLSCSDGVLEAVGALLRAHPGVLMQTHLNESLAEIRTVAELFPEAIDYLATYERHGLVTPRSVFAHNVHVTDSELARLGEARAPIAHCPSSNMFIGSGLFAMKRHLSARVRFGLGSDVGGGTGFSLFKEGLMAYQTQMLLREDGYPLGPAHLLYLATRAGADALGLGDEVGDFRVGKQADFVVVRPPAQSTLATTLRHSPSAEASLGALFTLAREESVAAVYVGGRPLSGRERQDKSIG